jgi:hypothetical protein
MLNKYMVVSNILAYVANLIGGGGKRTATTSMGTNLIMLDYIILIHCNA